MKTFKIWLLTIVVLLCSTTVNAHDFEVDGIYYNITSETNLTVSVTYKGSDYSSAIYSGNIIIPSSVEYNSKTYHVTNIGIAAFNNCSNLTSVIIPEGVTTINENAFSGCSSLTSISIPKSVTNMGKYILANCSSLTEIYCMATTPPTIDNYTFSGNSDIPLYVPVSSVSSYNTDNKWKTLSNIRPFGICGDNLTWRLTLEGELNIEGEGGIYDYTPNDVPWNKYKSSIYTVAISDGVTRIGDYAFYNCTNLTSINIPESVISIGMCAIYGCDNLSEIHINDIMAWCNIDFEAIESNPLYCGAGNFYLGGELLTNLTIPNTVKEIKDYVFASCYSLISVTFPETLTSIGREAFYACHNLTTVNLPKNVMDIGENAFAYCSNLTSIIVEDGNTTYDSRNNCNAIIETNSNTLILGSATTIIPDDVTGIGESAFEYNLKLTSITIPKSVTNIGRNAFYGCRNLASITCEAINPPTINLTNVQEAERVFDGVDKNIPVYVPKLSASAYQSAISWNQFRNFQPIAAETVEIFDSEVDFTQVEDEVFNKITYTRTLNNTAWNALYVPFEIPVSQLMDDYEVAYINGIHSYDDDDNGEIDRMSMEVVKVKSGTLLANHPYLIKARTEEAKQMNITVNNTTLYAAKSTTLDCSSVYTKYEITGIYEKMADSQLAGCYALSGGSWKLLASGSYLNPFRLYLRITSRGNSPVKVSPLAMTRIGIHVQGEESSTSVEELLMQEQPKEEIIYDLLGRRVENPVKGHIYIVNGKKRVY